MRRVLVTGFPGFLAGFLVEELLPLADRLDLLVEGRFREAAEARAAAYGPKCRVVVGDITAPDLGLEPRVRDEILAEAETVFHLAAVYDLGMSRELGMKVNVGGTERVNDLVRRMKSLDRYNYISTCYVSGGYDGHVREEDFLEGIPFRNYYEETKYLAEKTVRPMRGEYPVTIFRPAVVVGHSRTGATMKYDGPYMMLQAIRRLPAFLARINVGCEQTINIVPIDFVAAAMARIAARPEAAGLTFQLADPAPYSTLAICDLFSEIALGKRTWTRLPSPVVRTVSKTPLVTWIYGLPSGAARYFYSKTTYDSANTQRFLEGTGIACPRLTDYAPNLVKYFMEHPVPGK